MEEQTERLGRTGGVAAGRQAAHGEAVEQGDECRGLALGIGDAQRGQDRGGQPVVGLHRAGGRLANRWIVRRVQKQLEGRDLFGTGRETGDGALGLDDGLVRRDSGEVHSDLRDALDLLVDVSPQAFA